MTVSPEPAVVYRPGMDRRYFQFLVAFCVVLALGLVALGVWVNVDNNHKQKACRDRGGVLVGRGHSVCIKQPAVLK